MSSVNRAATLPEEKTQNPLRELLAYGQSVWLDYIRRDLFTSGELVRLVKEDGLRGMTSNPAIFEKAIAGSGDYADQLRELTRRGDLDAKSVFELLAIQDIQSATDALRPVYDQSKKRDGYVSLEVSPTLAHKTQETLDEARRLWKAVGRANTMIKVPGTPEGIPAFRQLISEGINVNVTLLFAQDVYEQVAWAYLEGLEARAKSGGELGGIASVASFFVSRIDTLIDSMIADKLKDAKLPAEQQVLLRGLQGKVAIANAKLAYQAYEKIFSGPRWEALAARGAQTQRVLWASTSTKNPAYRDVIYVEELIGADTVNTIPPATFDAFRDHGRLRASLTEDVEGARRTMQDLERAGISMKKVTDQLTDEGVKLFADAFTKLLAAVEKSVKQPQASGLRNFSYQLPAELDSAVKATLADWKAGNKVQRLWARDASLWSGADEGQWLGWLDIADEQAAHLDSFTKLAAEIRAAGLTHLLLLGMGGSSLCVEVLKLTFGRIAGGPEVHILDSTDPAQVRAVEKQIDIAKTIFVVSSKSGSTLEPNIFKQYFLERASQALGAAEAGKRFLAVTDPGSKMEQVAKADGFRHIFYGVPSIGGRYSALSNFGAVPGAIQGLDMGKFFGRATQMGRACGSGVAAEQNPGVVLGAILGTAQRQGRDKVTIFASPTVFDLGAWLEQLLAESTGKQGKGLIPVDREALAAPAAYGKDRVFVYLRDEAKPDAAQDAAVGELEKAGEPVLRIALGDLYDVAGEFFRWEMATAVAGSVIGINAFNQPDVEASKIETRKLTTEYEQKGSLPPESPILADAGILLYTDGKNAAALQSAAGGQTTLAAYLRAHLGRLAAGDYFALLGYIEMNAAHESRLQSIRHAVRDKKRVATCLGFGPRFLHSTGQAYKGGPNSGVFLQVTCDDAADLPVPQQKYTFGVVKAAQARGDFQVLADRGRRALRVHLGKDVDAALAVLQKAIEQALA